jgi:hypothetical protein
MNPVKKAMIGGGLVLATMTGGAIGAMMVNGSASAQTTSTTAPASPDNSDANRPAFDPSKGGHMSNGVTETLLTGDDAAKAKAAALAASPGATVQRVETDAEGAAYEAHILKSDGTPATVKMDKDFKVTSVDAGGPGGPGHGRGGDTAAATASSAT